MSGYSEAKSSYAGNDKLLKLIFDGNSAGDQAGNSPEIKLTTDNVTFITSTNAIINITTYGAVDEWVEGEFSGTLNGKELTNGKFKVIRRPDL